MIETLFHEYAQKEEKICYEVCEICFRSWAEESSSWIYICGGIRINIDI